ncbi:5-oxoprolinase subunit PxpB [Microbulbifer sp. VTAC004]|uniref:5-oxoprolinase subunit PxpB n=1 Tax=Microbulbifer TaxID=48073 RepID=UPI00036B5C8B|nr:5-oxoprolinase subunit PxpB [Microbulbifer variabilis]
MISTQEKPRFLKLEFDIIANGDCALDIRFSAEPSELLSRYIIGLRQYILKQDDLKVIDLIPAYQCLTITFDPLLYLDESLSREVKTLTKKFLKATNSHFLEREPCVIRIPVCYENSFAPDMLTVSEYTGLTPEEIIELHSTSVYLVHMLGFSPGFLYLGGLDPKLHCPRKEAPRLHIPAGAVGIGGGQTGIYPQATPGGWQIIGQTPIKLFQPYNTSPFIAQPLDTIEFYSISESEFNDIAPQVQCKYSKESYP